MNFDLHAHILPDVDDGAKDLKESLALLEQMKQQGITSVMATPHFYASADTAEGFKKRTQKAYNELCKAAAGNNLPNILLGSEVLYFRYIGSSESIGQFCLNRSKYLLLELSSDCIHSLFFEDLRLLQQDLGITPIIAHMERYHRFPGYKKLIAYVKENQIPVQINASALMTRFEARSVWKLFKEEVVTYLATDAHSVEARPPYMQEALAKITEKLGLEQANRLVSNSLSLLEEITAVQQHEK